MNTCERCGTELITDCPRCGAPNCCPKCCEEAGDEWAQGIIDAAVCLIRRRGFGVVADGTVYGNGVWVDSLRIRRIVEREPGEPPKCNHRWITKRAGGDPTDAGSDELICACEICGMEKPDDSPAPAAKGVGK